MLGEQRFTERVRERKAPYILHSRKINWKMMRYLLLSYRFPCFIFTSPMSTTLHHICTFPACDLTTVSINAASTPALCLWTCSTFVICCDLSPTAYDQVVVQPCSLWFMTCWISPNLVMDVILTLRGASIGNFIRFHDTLRIIYERCCRGTPRWLQTLKFDLI